VPTGGISGVASPPENRRQGYIGRLLHAVLCEIRERGWPLSTLYPFYFPFYKRYGWEHVSDNYEYKIPMTHLPVRQPAGTWHAVLRSTDMNAEEAHVSDDDVATLMEIYNAWAAAGRTGPVVRDTRWWRLNKLREGSPKRPDLYYWRDPAGQPRAYVNYSFVDLSTPWERRLQVGDMAALDIPAFQAVLGFLRNHDSQAKEVKMFLPEDIRLAALLDDPEFTIEVQAGFMLRLVDVAAALAARRYPAGVSAHVTLAIHDSFLPWNTGTYGLEVRDGVGVASRIDEEPGLSMDQRTLGRLYSGYMTASEAARLHLLEVHNLVTLEAADRIFAGPRPYMADFF
jgi:predicted acetyltransferase